MFAIISNFPGTCSRFFSFPLSPLHCGRGALAPCRAASPLGWSKEHASRRLAPSPAHLLPPRSSLSLTRDRAPPLPPLGRARRSRVGLAGADRAGALPPRHHPLPRSRRNRARAPPVARSTSPSSLSRHRDRARNRHRPALPADTDHTNELTGEARVFLLLSPLPLPLFRRPILVAGGVSIVVTHSSAPGLGVGQNRPAGRLFPRGARPRTRPGPARGPDPSGWSPACAPDWAGSEAGGLCHCPGLRSGLGRPVGRPEQ